MFHCNTPKLCTLTGFVLLSLSVWLCGPAAAVEVYETPDVFVSRSFNHEPPDAAVLYPDETLRRHIVQILGHRYAKFRIRYWLKDARSVWILEEIGKERPITCGFAVGAEGIEEFRVLIFRESRGWEVRYKSFARQFTGAVLGPSLKLDRRIDNVTGATLSVRAVTRLARLALLLHDTVV